MNIDQFRIWCLAIAEMIDAWRLIPRAVGAGYIYLVYYVVEWYMNLKPYMLEACTSPTLTDCIVQSPTTQQTALITAVISLGAAIFGFYTGTGRKWGEGIKFWKTKPSKETLQE